MSLRCRLGWHRYEQVPTVEERPNSWTRYWSNAKCARCGARAWFNWPFAARAGKP